MTLTIRKNGERCWDRWVDSVFGIGEEIGTHEIIERLKEKGFKRVPKVREISNYMKRSEKYEYIRTKNVNLYFKDELSYNNDSKYNYYNYWNYRISIFRRVG